MTAAAALQVLEEFASTQWGLVTTAQAQVLGVSRVVMNRLAADGVVQRVRHGVYALPSAVADPLQDLHAAWLVTDRKRGGEERVMGGVDVVVSHFSAAAVHGLGDIIPTHHEFTSAVRKQSAQPDVRFHRLKIAEEDVVLVNGLPVTSVTRSVADVASAAIDFDHLASIVRDGLSHPSVAYSDLAEALNRSAGKFGHSDGTSLTEACLEKAGVPAVAEDFLSSLVFERSLRPVLQRITEQYASAVMPEALRQAIQEVTRAAGQAGANSLPQMNFSTEAIQAELTRALRGSTGAKREVESTGEPRHDST